MKDPCTLPDPGKFPLLLTILKAPDELSENQEIAYRDLEAWPTSGKCYGRVLSGVSGAGRRRGSEIELASQIHGQVDAVIEVPWGTVSRNVTHNHAIRLTTGTGKTVVYQVISADNVNEENTLMQFVCRKTSPS